MNKRVFLFLALALGMTILLGRIDQDSSGFADLWAWENVPAIFLYTGGFFLMFALLFGLRGRKEA